MSILERGFHFQSDRHQSISVAAMQLYTSFTGTLIAQVAVDHKIITIAARLCPTIHPSIHYHVQHTLHSINIVELNVFFFCFWPLN